MHSLVVHGHRYHNVYPVTIVCSSMSYWFSINKYDVLRGIGAAVDAAGCFDALLSIADE